MSAIEQMKELLETFETQKEEAIAVRDLAIEEITILSDMTNSISKILCESKRLEIARARLTAFREEHDCSEE